MSPNVLVKLTSPSHKIFREQVRMNAILQSRSSTCVGHAASFGHAASEARVSPLQNHLLASLPDDVQARLFPMLEACQLTPGAVIARPDMRLDYCYFPVDCLISRHCMVDDDAGTAMTVVGNDGVIGIDFFMDCGSAPLLSLVQIGGSAFRLSIASIREELDAHEDLQTAFSQHSHALLAQMAQTAVCNRHHTLAQQLCRWLLLSLDRLPTDNFRITQDRISQSLGVHRKSLLEAARSLQKAGVVKCSKGHLSLVDRNKLEGLSCGCDQIVAREMHRPWPAGVPLIDPALQRTGAALSC